MKCKYLFILISAITLVSCGMDHDAINQTIYEESVKYNAEQKLGVTIDPEHTWSAIHTGFVTINADAPLTDIVKVQILTESPIMNEDARTLTEAQVMKGQNVTLTYDAPAEYERLIAACVDSKGRYYIKGFNIGDTEVSFKNSTARTRGTTRAATSYPAPSYFVLNPFQMQKSYNAKRAIFANQAANTGSSTMKKVLEEGNISQWHNSGWETERLWRPTNQSTGTDWSIVNGTVVRSVSNFTDEQRDELKDFFGEFLQHKTGGVAKDNRQVVKNSKAFQFYNNQLTSDGTNPITVTPIFLSSTENGDCHIYYYYYNPADIPAGMTEANYIKTLPKFKAIQLWHTKSQANDSYSNYELNKIHEYLLPYYGDPSAFTPNSVHANTLGTFSHKLYRIRNARQLNDVDYYMTYNPSNDDMYEAYVGDDKLAPKYDDNYAKEGKNINHQLWQIFTTKDGKTLLYNVGSGKFLIIHDKSRWETSYSAMLSKVENSYLDMKETGDPQTYYFKRSGEAKGLGTDLGGKNNKRISTDKTESNGDNFKWILEEYKGEGAMAPVTDVILDDLSATASAAPSAIIPQGYRIGFLIRKLKNSGTYVQGYRDITDCNHGCCFGYGGMNIEINAVPGHFESSLTKYSMQAGDPRACYIVGNGRVFIGFEDGADCQYNDVILAVGGYDEEALEETVAEEEAKGTGLELDYLYDEDGVEAAAYTMCFEDRPEEADYDMNDVVLQAIRKNETTIKISLVACGAQDEVYLRGITGSRLLNNREIHDILQLTDDKPFANTQVGGQTREAVTELITVSKDRSTEEYLRGIYIENRTTGKTVRMPVKGASPNAIIVPINFKYPTENTSIKTAYPGFLEWAQDMNAKKDWYRAGEITLIFPTLFKTTE